MRLKKEVLLSRCKRPLRLTKFLDISGLELARVDRLERCENLHWLIASDNKLEADDGLDNLKQLWYLDISNNNISYIICLPRYLALGTLILSNNNIKWKDLEKIQHAHFLSISLHGNPCLDADPYYRIHVIDCLPLIWELDGRLVTVTERLHVKQFFIDSELSPHPVRHKLGKSFRTTAIKNIGTEGIVSKQCKYIYSKFPMSETHTKHTDERRLRYLTHMVQENILQWSQELKRGNPNRPTVTGNFLNRLLEQRYKDVERCNMVTLLLVITLEFQLPTALMKSVLNTAHLDMIGSVNTMPFFLLPPTHRTRVICILLNAAKVDRDNNIQHSGGLYPELFMCLYYTVAQLTRISQTSPENMDKIKPIPPNSDYKVLMASEVVSLMLQVPRYFTYLLTDAGVINLTSVATGDIQLIADAQEKLEEAENVFNNIPLRRAHKKVSKMILNAIQERLAKINIRMADIPVGDRYLALSDSLPIKPLHSVIWASQFLAKGLTVPRLDPPILNPAREAAKPKPQEPRIGDQVLLGPQVVGEIHMLMEGDIGMVKMDGVPIANGAVESKLKFSDPHYTFVDLKALCFAKDVGMWRPIKTTGDKYTIHSVDATEMVAIANVHTSVMGKENTQPLIYTPRTKTPMVYAPGARKNMDRPQSSMVAGNAAANITARRAVSAGPVNITYNAISYIKDQDLEEAFPEIDDDGAENENESAKQKMSAVINSEILHLHDNVHHIRGLTPREDSSRSVTLTLTPQSTTRVPEFAAPVSSRSNSPVLETVQEKETGSPEVDSQSDATDASPGPKAGQAHSGTEAPQSPGQEKAQELPSPQQPKVNDDPEAVMTQESGQGQENPMEQTEEASPRDNQQPKADVPQRSSHDLHKETPGAENGAGSCPFCVAHAENTFLTSVTDQGEGFEIPSEKHEKQTAEDVKCAESAEDKNVHESNAGVTFQNYAEVISRPKTSRPTVAARMRIGDQKVPRGRPKSAAETSRFVTISHPPSVVATGQSARLDGQKVFKTDFQQQREEAWKRATRHRKPRPFTAITQRSNSQFPPPQRPSSPTFISTNLRNPGLKITRTEKWLGGGRDLFWESVRQRPKSGHTPGWKEGLPESMKKTRPKSAYVTSQRTTVSQLSSSPLFVTSCSNCQELKVAHPGYAVTGISDDLDVTLIMPQSQPILQHSHRLPLTSPVSQDGQNPFSNPAHNSENR